MKTDYFFFYTEANVVCILILLILLINDRVHGTKQERQIWFNQTIIAHILYFISDICWAAVLSGALPRTRLYVGLFNFTNFILMNILAFEWFMYMAASEKMPFRKSRKRRSMWRIPMTISIAVLVVVYVVDPKFWINENVELNILYYPLMIAAPVLYLMAAFIMSMINARKTDSRDEKFLYRLIGVYPLTVLAFGLVQVFVLNAPLFCFGCTLMLLFFYIQNMQTMVSVDSLTRLNNRGQINRYMEQAVRKENVDIRAVMIDIDGFKEINDTYGHAEGDRALILVADVLRQACERCKAPVFLGRYGGDEFTVFIQNPEEDEAPERMMEVIRAALRKKQLENRLPYELNISAGWDALKGPGDTLEACLNRADEKLYKDKRARKVGR